MRTYYTYLWLREKDGTFPAGTPYYAGKGSGNRAFVQKSHRFPPPENQNCILVQEFPDENSAFAAELFLIFFYGREDTGTGCLLNLTAGGENPPNQKGKPRSAKALENMRAAQTKRFKNGAWSADAIRKMSAAKKGKPGVNSGRKWKHSMPRSAKHCRQISERQIGRVFSMATRQKMSTAKKNNIPWNKGRTGGTWSAARRAAFDKSRKITIGYEHLWQPQDVDSKQRPPQPA